MKGYFHTSAQVNPYVNLAIEEHLLKSDAPVLYFWQNANTVVIGRNQNAYTECNMDYVASHGTRVARRLTGGGAVYHDLGNLNFSIILPKELHDITRSTGVIVRALASLGIPVSASGRNDILLDGKKISGNAYYSNSRVGLHHGTVLFALDAEAITQALAVSEHKKSRHGIASVRSRVTDIASHFPGVSITDIETAIRDSFCDEYGIDALEPLVIDETALEPLVSRYSSFEWNYGRINEYDVSREESFGWGTVRVSVRFAGNAVEGCEISSDSLDPDAIDEARRVLNDWQLGGVSPCLPIMEGRGILPPAANTNDSNPIVDDILNVYKGIVLERNGHDS